LFFVYVVAWVVIGVGTLEAAPRVIKLLTGRAEPPLTEPGAWRKVWSDLQHSLTTVACGLSLLGIVAGEADPLWQLLGVPLTVFAGWDLISWVRSRVRGKPEPGPDAVTSTPGTGTPDMTPGPRRPGLRELPLPMAGASATEVADWVERKTFSTTRLRPGYDEEEVDVFLDMIRDTLLGVRQSPLTPDEVLNIQFSKTRLRPGYVEEDVDTFLADVGMRLAT
jgi:DivIVA domain-containing protein